MFGFNKATLIAILSLSLSSAILLYSSRVSDGLSFYGIHKEREDRLLVHEKYATRSRNLLKSVVHTALSSILKFLFENPLSGEHMKTMSCFAAFFLAEVDFSKVERFGDWFNDESVMELYAAGKYYGLDGITEYVEYIYSEDFASYEFLSDPEMLSEITKESNTCNITYAGKRRIRMTEDMFPAGTCYEFLVGSTARFTLTGDDKYILVEKVNGYYPEAFLSSFFGASNDGAYADRICSIMEENCGDVWKENEFADQAECKASVDAMPVAEGLVSVDGLSQGCRWLHSVFVKKNEDHCPHISTVPLQDINGKVKCQSSKQTQSTSVFSAAALNFFEETAVNEFELDESMSQIC